ncbi:S-layer homology domain-containing protein [Ureibacillus acetophenoni]|uniref:S-layer family protein n=1 Tax=Ureibacillus acetophenoni TaxID=614649 RepID=A0A285U2Y1_9BACL|nr:S-layer homology domain-containing protein [Ureibacillus acetophenoni]SOC34846.1 S-layer family protein [Ureibacillus acetophenoni]
MKVRYYLGLGILFTVLVISVSTSNLTFADENVNRAIKVDLVDENRLIDWASVSIVSEETGYETGFNFDRESESFIVEEDSNIDLYLNYTVTWRVEFSESGQRYVFFDQVSLTGDEIFSLNTISVPTLENLRETSIVNDVEEIESSNLRLIVGNRATSWHYLDNHTPIHLLVKEESSLLIKFSLQGQGTMENSYLIYDEISFSNESNLISDYVENLAHLQIEEPMDTIYFNMPGISFTAQNAKDIYISKGKYNINYYIDNLRWTGTVTIENDEILNLPSIPTQVDVTLRDFRTDDNDPTKVTIGYEVKANSSNFHADNLEFTTKLLKDEAVIEEFISKSNYNHKTVDFGDYPSGTYTLLVSVTKGNESITGSTSITYTSPWQELKGTILTAENEEGIIMKDTVVELYQKVSQRYEKVTEEKATTSGNIGEVFIPDAYILKDQDYVLVVRSDENKVAYIYDFIGQSTKQIHLEGSELDEFQFDTAGLKTVELILDYNYYYTIPVSFLSPEWKVDFSLPFNLTWYGESIEGTVGYEYFGPINNNEIQWNSYKPSIKYKNATIGRDFEDAKYLHYNTTQKHWPLTLKVKDGEIIYEGLINLDKGIDELAFGEYTGEIIHVNSDNIYIQYRSIASSLMNISGDNLKFVYSFEDESGNITELTTNNFNSILLDKELIEGVYKVSLVSATINEEIVKLKMKDQFVTLGEVTPKKILDKIYLNPDTPYGKFHYGNIQIFDPEEQYPGLGYPYQLVTYNYNDGEQAFVAGYSNKLEPNKKYTALIKIHVKGKNSYIPVIELREITGTELLAISDNNPLEISGDLRKLIVNADDGLLDDIGVQFNFNVLDSDNFSQDISGNEKIEAYLSPGTYKGFIKLQDINTKKYIDIPEFQLLGDKVITLNKRDLAKFEVLRNGVELPILDFNVKDNYLNGHLSNNPITSYYISKGQYAPFKVSVGIIDQYDTPWAYILSQENKMIIEDTQFEFTGIIDGAIDEINVINNRRIQAHINLSSGQFSIDGIYHAVKDSNRQLLTLSVEESPIRDYYGLFDRLNEVHAAYRVLDEYGREVINGASDAHNLTELDIYFPDLIDKHTYTLEVTIPTSPRNSLKLEKQFTVDLEQGRFVNITSPAVYSILNNEIITIEGKANEGAMLAVTVMQGNVVVDSKNFNVTSERTFSVPIKILHDGNYTVTVSNEDIEHSLQFTVDRTAPESVKNIELIEDKDGLRIAWEALEEFMVYKVEVAENDGEFIEVVSQTSTNYVLSNLKPSSNYSIRIIAIDLAGNSSVSKIVTKKATTQNPGSGNDDGNPGDTDNDSGSDNSGGSGNNSGSNNGGNTTNTTPESQSEQSVVVNKVDILDQLNDSTSTQVTVAAKKLTQENSSSIVEVPSTTLKSILETGKTLIISTGEVTIEIPTAILQELSQNKQGNIQFLLELVHDHTIDGSGQAISDVYEFSIKGEVNGELTSFTNFSKYIDVSIPVNENEIKDLEKVAVYYINEQTNTLEYVVSKIEDGKLTFKTNHFSKFVGIENNKTFIDIKNSWAKNYIESLASKSIINGINSEEFAPNDSITRSQFAVLLARALNLQKKEYEGIFLDVNESMTWSVYEIEAAYRVGIINGYNGKFNPDEKITRDQMATMIIRAIQYVDPLILENVLSSNVAFVDGATIPEYAKESVLLASGLEIISGKQINGQLFFAPSDYATRAETAKMLYMMLENL